MKNHELLDLIGEAGEDYVLEAGNNVIKPRFGWKKLAACAACAALVLAAYPVYRTMNPPLHGYTVLEGGTLSTEGDIKAPAGEKIDIPGQDAPVPDPAQPSRGDGPNDIQGGAYIGDAPVQDYASGQYDKLLRGMGMYGEGASSYPDWFAGAWIDWETLRVAIVDGLRTPELEAEITGWCGDGVAFQSAKYSHNFLDGLMEPVPALLDGTGLTCGIGVDVSANCLGVDLYSDGAAIPNSVLAELARLDPAGDAIRVRVFTQSMSTLTDEIKKGPAPDRPASEPVPGGVRAEPNVENVEPEPTPIAIEDSEWTMPAEEPGEIKDLPEPKAAAEPTPQPAEDLPDVIEDPDE